MDGHASSRVLRYPVSRMAERAQRAGERDEEGAGRLPRPLGARPKLYLGLPAPPYLPVPRWQSRANGAGSRGGRYPQRGRRENTGRARRPPRYRAAVEEDRENDADMQRGYRIYRVVGVAQDTLQSGRVRDDGVELLKCYDGTDCKGDGMFRGCRRRPLSTARRFGRCSRRRGTPRCRTPPEREDVQVVATLMHTDSGEAVGMIRRHGDIDSWKVAGLAPLGGGLLSRGGEGGRRRGAGGGRVRGRRSGPRWTAGRDVARAPEPRR
jgi:hypothetical protein